MGRLGVKSDLLRQGEAMIAFGAKVSDWITEVTPFRSGFAPPEFSTRFLRSAPPFSVSSLFSIESHLYQPAVARRMTDILAKSERLTIDSLLRALPVWHAPDFDECTRLCGYDLVVQSGSISGGWSVSVTTTGTTATSFSNSNAINRNDVATIYKTAAPYPSTIDVSSQTGVLSWLKVTLTGFSHNRAQDVDVLLVSPSGTNSILMSDAGSAATSNATFIFEDSPPNNLPNSGAMVSGTYRITNIFCNNARSDAFPTPAPQPPANGSALSELYGYSPNGTWSLYVVDDEEGEAGTLAGTWSLDITTTPYVPPTIGCLVPAFAVSTSLTVGSSPTGIATGDFNNDAKQDLVIANQGANNVSVALGDGMGGFGTANTFAAQSNPYSVAVGNFNADANLDIVVVNSGSNNISILLGNRTGGFSAPTNFIVGISPISVAVGDFNSDTTQDLAVANYGGFFAGTVSVFLGTGNGNYSSAVNYAVRTQPSFVAVGNFDNDANPDLAVSNFGSSVISVLLGSASGSFTFAPEVQSGAGRVAIAMVDLMSLFGVPVVVIGT